MLRFTIKLWASEYKSEAFFPRWCNGSTRGFGPLGPSSNLGWGIINSIMQIITPLLTLQNTLRVHHWQTKSYAEHKALGKAYEDLDPLIDQFVEVYFGKYGNINAKESFKINLENYKAGGCKEIIDELDKNIRQGRDILKRKNRVKLSIRKEEPRFSCKPLEQCTPEFVIKNQDKFKHLIFNQKSEV